MLAREYANRSEVSVTIVKDDTTIHLKLLPSILYPSGLSDERQPYLFEHIRQFCEEKYRDITCPKPAGIRPSGSKRPCSNEQNQGFMKKSKHLCSHCQQPGHTKTRKGQILCPQLLKKNKNKIYTVAYYFIYI